MLSFAAAAMIFLTSAKTALGIGTDRLYWAIFQVVPSRTSTPLPRAGPRLGECRMSRTLPDPQGPCTRDAGLSEAA